MTGYWKVKCGEHLFIEEGYWVEQCGVSEKMKQDK
jgi:hypothetical protein